MAHSSTDIDIRAKKLLGLQPQENEATIRHHLCQLLEGLTEGSSEMVLEYSTSSGRSDIYLPRLRTIIEVKTHGGVENPDAFEQLQRYVLAEIERARREESSSNRRWTGILTDGTTWHFWSWEHRHNPAAQQEEIRYRTSHATILVQKLTSLLEGELVGKPWIPDDPVELFREFADGLRHIHDKVTDERQLALLETKRRLWLEMLQGSGMAPRNRAAQDRLFVAHTFLVSLARGVEHAVTKPDTTIPDPQDLLNDGFVSWTLNSEPGRIWARSLLSRVAEYEWRQTRGDVLRPLYERFVSDSDRKDFGEFYTPDWLAQMLVRDVLDEDWCFESVGAAQLGDDALNGVGVLDPTCGSGTFLYHAAQRLLESSAMNDLTDVQRADIVCRLVNGIDIHPVAAEFSRATILRALPGPPAAGPAAVRIYQGDTLMLRGNDENSLFRPLNGEIRIWTPRGATISLPRSFTELSSFPDLLRRLVLSAANSQVLPAAVSNAVSDPVDQKMIVDCHREFGKIIKCEGNSVWTWYITNIIGPEQLSRRKVNRIVANPPWVKLANIQVLDRKRRLESFAGKSGKKVKDPHMSLWVGGKHAPHFDIAQLFIKRSRQLYLARPKHDPAAWVVKASALRAGNWEKFRKWHRDVLAQSLDLSDVQVFGGGDAQRSCVLYDTRAASLPQGENRRALKASCPKDRPTAASTLDQAAELLQWSVEVRFPRVPSDYEPGQWKQGATVLPKVLVMLDRSSPSSQAGYTTITTCRSQKLPWKELDPRTGDIPKAWIIPLLTSKHLLPFAVSPQGSEQVVIPLDKNGYLLSHKTARLEPFWAELDDLYHELRSQGQNTPQTLLARIDYNNGLTVQLPLRKFERRLVVYPKSGDIMRACRLTEDRMILQDTTYRHLAETIEEAAFLIAVLNAPALTAAFAQSRTSQRDFHKNPWKSVPIPQFNPANATHRELAALANQAEDTVRTMVAEAGDNWPKGQVAASKRIRQQLEVNGIAGEIDAQVAKILPDHGAREK